MYLARCKFKILLYARIGVLQLPRSVNFNILPNFQKRISRDICRYVGRVCKLLILPKKLKKLGEHPYIQVEWRKILRRRFFQIVWTNRKYVSDFIASGASYKPVQSKLQEGNKLGSHSKWFPLLIFVQFTTLRSLDTRFTTLIYFFILICFCFLIRNLFYLFLESKKLVKNLMQQSKKITIFYI